MGSVFSKKVYREEPVENIFPGPRGTKRDSPETSSIPTDPQSVCEDVPTAAKRPRSDPSLRSEGGTHKYIVRCSTVYWCSRKEMGKILSKIEGLPPYGALHKIPRWDYFFITFPSSEVAEEGVAVLSGFSYRGEQWRVSPMAEHSAKQLERENTVAHSLEKSDHCDGVCLTAADVTAKLRDQEYSEQIIIKRRNFLMALRLVTKNLRKEIRDTGILSWLDEVCAMSKPRMYRTCCEFKDVVTAKSDQERDYYRNKTEFTVGLSPDSCGLGHDFHKSEVTIGYALGLVRNGKVFVGPVDENCKTTSRSALLIAETLTPVIRDLGMPVYDKRSHQGYWRQITCREGTRTGEVIVCVMVNPISSSAPMAAKDAFTKDDSRCQTEVVRALQRAFRDSKKLGIFWQSSDLVSAITSDVPAVHLHGIQSMHEEMCGLKFRIQPTAFFQINTYMAEKLYNLIGDLCQADKDSVVLDVCCGTGTIGLSLAKKVHSVVGIEMNESAIADAKYNAELNNIHNATFLVGKVESKIHEAISRVDPNRNCIVILDPPRPGVATQVVAAIRGMRLVSRVIYVSCAPKNFWKNAVAFMRPASKAFRLEPFQPTEAYGVDLFPHTDHGEMVVVLDRKKES